MRATAIEPPCANCGDKPLLQNGWTFTGGQMWSLVTETKKGLDNRTEALPMTIDPQYTVGFSWARQYGFRVTKNFNNKFWLGASVENPQVTFSAANAPTNFFFGAPGNAGGAVQRFQRNVFCELHCLTSSSRLRLNPASVTMKCSASFRTNVLASTRVRRSLHHPPLALLIAT